MEQLKTLFILCTIGLLVVIKTTAQDLTYSPEGTNINKTVVLNVDPFTFSKLSSTLEVYANLLTEEGYKIVLHQVTETTPHELKQYIKGVYQNNSELEGAIFIGNFPKPFSLVYYPESDVTLPAMSMEFFQDLDGEYNETTYPNFEFVYDNHTGHVQSEIWTSVIPAIGELNSDESITKLKDYFNRNFEYRKKLKKDLKMGFAEPIIGYKNMDVWQSQIDVFTKGNGNYKLRRGNLTITRDNIQSDNEKYPDAKYSYENELNTNNFDFANLGGHGSFYGYLHSDPSIVINIPWSENNPIKPLFIKSGACSAGEYFRYIHIGSIATTFLFNPEGNVLGFSTATENSYGGYKTSEGTWDDVLVNNLEKGFSWGKAMLYNFQKDVDPSYLQNGRTREVYSATRIFLGDGTLKFQEHMDYSGNDFPYIMEQEYYSISKNSNYTLTKESLTIKDNDNDKSEQSIIILEGENYTFSGTTIYPETDFMGYLNIPILLNDGIENGQEFNFILNVQDNSKCQLITRSDINTKRNTELEVFIEELHRDLPGRFYDFRTFPIEFSINGDQYLNLNLYARGTEVGVVRNQSVYKIVSNDILSNGLDANGCALLNADNFTIESISETCPDKDNGQLIISAQQAYDYKVTVNGTEYSMNSSSELIIDGLFPDTYEVCIEVSDQTSPYCYTLTIEEGTTVSGKASSTKNKTNVEIIDGTAPYEVFVNGNTVLRTMSSTFDIDTKHGDLIVVKTDKSCEGIYSNTIQLFDIMTLFPNPTQGSFELAIPLNLVDVEIELYNYNSQLISKDTYQVSNGKVQLDLSSKAVGMYYVKVLSDTPVMLKIIKK